MVHASNKPKIQELEMNKNSFITQKNIGNLPKELQGLPIARIGICKNCGIPFEKNTTWHIFHNEECRLQYHGVDSLLALKRKKQRK